MTKNNEEIKTIQDVVEISKLPIFMQDINETNEEYRKRIREYMEQTDDR
jgi:hypothetical protein